MGELTEPEKYEGCVDRFNENVDLGYYDNTPEQRQAYIDECMPSFVRDPEAGFENSIQGEYQNLHEMIQEAVMVSADSKVLVVVEPGGTPEQIAAAQISVMQASSVLGEGLIVSVGTDASVSSTAMGFALTKIEDVRPIESGDENVLGALSKYASEDGKITIHFGDVENPQSLENDYGSIMGVYPSEIDIVVDPSLNKDIEDIKAEIVSASEKLMPEVNDTVIRGPEFMKVPETVN